MNISTNASINTYADSDYYNHYNIKNSDDPNKTDSTNRPSSPEECQTCKNRKYADGSDENVSYKSAAHIAPGAAGNAVRAHEGEHVSNAYTKASQNNGKVISASVSIHTSVCPECGRTYVSGGTTNTMIKYPNESNPYQQERKSQDALRFTGNIRTATFRADRCLDSDGCRYHFAVLRGSFVIRIGNMLPLMCPDSRRCRFR